jgi:hypothetical protein
MIPIVYIRKSRSRFMKALAWLLRPLVPNFLDGYSTTIGNRIYLSDHHWPAPWLRQDRTRVLSPPADPIGSPNDDHERVHAEKQNGFLCRLLRWDHPIPYWIGTVIVSVIWLLFPLPVLFALGRYYLERDGFLAGARGYIAQGQDPDAAIDAVTEYLCGRSYGWAGWIWPGRRRTRRWFAQRLIPDLKPPG